MTSKFFKKYVLVDQDSYGRMQRGPSTKQRDPLEDPSVARVSSANEEMDANFNSNKSIYDTLEEHSALMRKYLRGVSEAMEPNRKLMTVLNGLTSGRKTFETKMGMDEPNDGENQTIRVREDSSRRTNERDTSRHGSRKLTAKRPKKKRRHQSPPPTVSRSPSPPFGTRATPKTPRSRRKKRAPKPYLAGEWTA